MQGVAASAAVARALRTHCAVVPRRRATSSTMMRAVVSDGAGNAVVTERPIPTAGPFEQLVRVRAASLNRADLLQAAGKYMPPPGVTDILGLEMSGTLVCDERVSVTALLYGGAMAEYAVIPHHAIVSLPPATATARLTHTQRAAIPEAFVAAHHTLFDVARVQDGDTVIVNAAASGVGTAALQLLRHCRPRSRVIATTRSPAKREAVRLLGAHHVLHPDDTDGLIAAVRAESASESATVTGAVAVAGTGRRDGADVVLDCAGAAQFRTLAAALRVEGRWVMYGLLSGARSPSLSLAPIVAKRLTLRGVTLRAQTPQQRARAIDSFVSRAGDAFAHRDGLKPVIHTQFEGLDAVGDAFRVMRENENIGKIVLNIA